MGEIRFVGTGETRGYPYLVCKKLFSTTAVILTFNDSKKKNLLWVDAKSIYKYHTGLP